MGYTELHNYYSVLFMVTNPNPCTGLSSTTLAAGKVTNIRITVTAEDGVVKKSYTVAVTRQMPPCTKIMPWQPWGECKGKCSTGISTRIRTVEPAVCPTERIEQQECKRKGSCNVQVKATTALTGVTKEQVQCHLSPTVAPLNLFMPLSSSSRASHLHSRMPSLGLFLVLVLLMFLSPGLKRSYTLISTYTDPNQS